MAHALLILVCMYVSNPYIMPKADLFNNIFIYFVHLTLFIPEQFTNEGSTGTSFDRNRRTCLSQSYL